MRDAAAARRLRRIGVVGGAVALIAIAGVFALRALRERSAELGALPQLAGTLPVEGLDHRVTIYRDARGVPHVEAASERDAWFALGFVHAQDRLAQMLWLRQRAQGRAAEVLGRRALAADRMARTIDFAGLAERQLPHLDAGTRRVLDAYAAGVNARIARIRAGEVAPPLVVERLGLALDPWRAEDSLAVFKLHAWGLGASVDAVLVLDDLIQALGPEAAGRFFPGGDLDESLPASGKSVRRDTGAPEEMDALRRDLGIVGIQPGSSAWVLGGAHTKSGLPIVVVDHHLPTSLPAWLHLDHVRGGDLDVAGVSLPGVPVFWSGHNQRVAWGAVAAGAVVTDLYSETLDPKRPGRYHDGRRWRPLAERVEQIRVRGAEPVQLRVQATLHGPLLPGREGRTPLSVAWTGARTDGPSGIGSLLAVARANGAGELLAALERHHEPAIAVVYADADGAAGMQVAGWIPERSLSPQLQPLPGRARFYDWNAPVPFDALPSARLVDGQGWIVAADASLAPLARARIDWLWSEGARAERIDALLRDAVRKGHVDLRSMAALQNDVVGARVEQVVASIEKLAAAIDAPLGPPAAELLRILREWDGASSEDSQGAAAYHVLLEPLSEALLAKPIGDALWRRYVSLPRTDDETLLAGLLADAAAQVGSGSDRARAVAHVVRESLREAWLRLSYRLGPNRERWTWGRLHRIRFRAFGGLDGLLGDVSVAPHPYPGTAHTVRVGPYDPLAPFAVSMASTARMAFDAGSLGQSLAIVAPGESEHPGSPYFDDQLEPWLEGRTGLLVTGSLLVEETAVARLVLEPYR